ncbi:MAG TPA: hypothetical protein V6C72_06380, partial [Chroococcales cyanobacterium]
MDSKTMTLTEESYENQTRTDESQPVEPAPGVETGTPSARFLAFLLLIFAGALAIRLWFNFLAPHANLAGCCDASEYVRNARAIANLADLATKSPTFFQDALNSLLGMATADQLSTFKKSLESLHEVYQGGPVFPLFILSALTAGAPFVSDQTLT